MSKRVVRAAGFLVTSTFALVSIEASACTKGEAEIFRCTTAKQKVVEVCAGKSDATYSFGRDGATPELRLVSPKAKLRYRSESGTGAETESLTFKNGKTTYTVVRYNSFAKLDENGNAGEEWPDEGSLEVESSGRVLASLECDTASLRTDFDALRLEPAQSN